MFSPFNSEDSHSDISNSPNAFTIEAEHVPESIKPNLFEKPDNIERICIREVRDSEKENKIINPLEFDPEALEKFQKVRVQKTQKPGSSFINARKLFAPFVCKTLEVSADIGFNYGANMYNAKHNMIICCPSDKSVHFYHADDLTPMKQHQKELLNSSVVQMSYCEETDTHLLGCCFGEVYAYNATLNKFNLIVRKGEHFILAITYIDENNFAFSSSQSRKLFFYNLKSKEIVQRDSNDSDAWYLHHIPRKNLLLAGLANGKIAIYQSEGRYPMIGSSQAHQFGKYVTMITSVNIKGKEYIITAGNDQTIKIWDITKGRMRFLKVIKNEDSVSTFVYLENYQMIAATFHKDYVKFFKMPHGKLEATVNLDMNKARNIFLMKDKNTIGIANLNKNVIKMIQLHHPKESISKIDFVENSHKDDIDFHV